MAEDPRDGELERSLAERGGHLLRAAVLLTGSDEAGEDLVQAALERLLRRGPAVHGDPEAYLRRIIYHLTAGVAGAGGGPGWRCCAATAKGSRLTAACRSSSGTNWSGCCCGCRRGSGPRSCCATGRT